MAILDINEIRAILPHRYPFLLVDRIVEMEADRIVGIKNVTNNEPFFQGHFPDFPVMPGVLIVEAMAQTAGVLVLQSMPDRHNKLVLLVAVENARFRRPVVPGDTLRMEMKVLKRRPAWPRWRAWPPWTAWSWPKPKSCASSPIRKQKPTAAPTGVTMPIHPTAIVDPAARIAESAEIGPYCIIGADVEIGARTRLMANNLPRRPHLDRRGQHLLPVHHRRRRLAGPEV